MKSLTLPPPYYVFVEISPTKKNGLRELYVGRIGTAHDAAGIRKVIADDRRAMGQTFGGLIDPVSLEGRHYRAFRAEWTELPASDFN